MIAPDHDRELFNYLKTLSVQQLQELTALMYLGRSDFMNAGSREFQEGLETAKAFDPSGTPLYLEAKPLHYVLPRILERLQALDCKLAD